LNYQSILISAIHRYNLQAVKLSYINIILLVIIQVYALSSFHR
jgi:hypothetical protein